MADVGLVGLVPVVPGSSMIPLTSLSHAAIEKLVAVTLAQDDLELGDLGGQLDIEDTIGGLDGGFVLRHDGAIVVEPACCCGLETLAEWESAAASDAWRDIWVGHDIGRLELRRTGAQCELRWGEWQGKEWRGGSVEAAERIDAALHDVRAQLMNFAARIATALPPTIAESARVAVARRLAGI
jgi:hypothetical protein